jgi:DNA polymerase-1
MWSEKQQRWASDDPNDPRAAVDWRIQPRRAKCKCKGHKKLREPVKNIDFGMAYGMSKFKLAGDMRWSNDKAEGVINDYFRTFKKLGYLLTYLGQFGLHRGFIQTIAPFFRKRWFPDHKYFTPADIEAHIKDIKWDKTLGHIERQSKNMPIQGTSADITKLSLCMMYWKIHDELQVEDKVHLVCQVHDQNDTVCADDYVDTWSPIMEQCMLDAALFVIPNGLLRVEMSTSPVWTK